MYIELKDINSKELNNNIYINEIILNVISFKKKWDEISRNFYTFEHVYFQVIDHFVSHTSTSMSQAFPLMAL